MSTGNTAATSASVSRRKNVGVPGASVSGSVSPASSMGDRASPSAVISLHVATHSSQMNASDPPIRSLPAEGSRPQKEQRSPSSIAVSAGIFCSVAIAGVYARALRQRRANESRAIDCRLRKMHALAAEQTAALAGRVVADRNDLDLFGPTGRPQRHDVALLGLQH